MSHSSNLLNKIPTHVNISIIGHGIVGKAVTAGFQDRCNLYIYDNNPQSLESLHTQHNNITICSNLPNAVENAKFIFICVPTPMHKAPSRHSFDSRHLDTTLQTIAEDKLLSKEHILIIKSTVVPSKVNEYIEKYPKLNLVICPEFLTEINFIESFLKPAYRIYGGKEEYTHQVHKLFEEYSICQPTKIAYCDPCSASLIKYMVNSFLATKVSLMNQFYTLAQSMNNEVQWDDLTKIFHYDERVGNSHAEVPGYDGQKGWGGKCLPKDVLAIIDDAELYNCNLDILQTIWEYNRTLRNDID